MFVAGLTYLKLLIIGVDFLLIYQRFMLVIVYYCMFLSYRGMCIYRTYRTLELILKGIPDKYRGEIWMVFSGATNEVGLFPVYREKVNFNSGYQCFVIHTNTVIG